MLPCKPPFKHRLFVWSLTASGPPANAMSKAHSNDIYKQGNIIMCCLQVLHIWLSATIYYRPPLPDGTEDSFLIKLRFHASKTHLSNVCWDTRSAEKYAAAADYADEFQEQQQQAAAAATASAAEERWQRREARRAELLIAGIKRLTGYGEKVYEEMMTGKRH